MKFKKSFNLFCYKKNMPDPPYEYDYLAKLNEKEYPVYLNKMFKLITGANLNLKKPKTFNEKIQWLKLYDNSPLKTQLTDKVLVRNWVKEKIGENYLKPALWIGKTFDEIPFETLPNSFIIKTNHGCKWQYKILNKEKFLSEEQLFKIIKSKFEGWLTQSFHLWAGFEMQYRDIKPQLIIEPLLIEEKQIPTEYEIYCFNGEPEIYQKIRYILPCAQVSVYNKDFSKSNISFNPYYIIQNEEVSENLKRAVILSKTLCKEFKLVRVDWMEYKGNLYFNEMTFTPHSGFFKFYSQDINEQLGNKLNLKERN